MPPRGTLSAPVEHLPGWAVRLPGAATSWGGHAFWGAVVERRLVESQRVRPPPSPSDDELIDALRSDAGRLSQVLAAADPTNAGLGGKTGPPANGRLRIRHQVRAPSHRWGRRACLPAIVLSRPAAASPPPTRVDSFFIRALGPADNRASTRRWGWCHRLRRGVARPPSGGPGHQSFAPAAPPRRSPYPRPGNPICCCGSRAEAPRAALESWGDPALPRGFTRHAITD